LSAAMRVLFVNPGRALGGAEHSLLLLLQAGLDVLVHCSHGS